MNCVSVSGAAGDVILNWSAPADPLNEFVSYNIFTSNSLNGTYTPLATITTLATTSYTYAGAGAQTAPKFFYITTTSTDGSTQPATDTVRTIFLVVTPSQTNTAYLPPIGGGVSKLQWNAISDPLHSSSGVSYSVYRKYSTGSFVLLGTTTGDRWNDTISVCYDVITYRVEITDANNCLSVSNEVAKEMTDMTNPKVPGIDSVSINNVTGETIMGLSPSTSPDATAYIIYIRVGFSYIAIDTVWGNMPIVYTNVGSTPTGGSEVYAVASIDSCGNPSFIGVSQNTIYLKDSYSLCDKSVLLGWNPYLHMKNGLLKYMLYVSVNGSPFTILDDTTGLAYTVENLQQNKTYQFFIRAIDSTGTITSTSNIVSFFSKTQPQPSFVYVKSVSVNEAQDIEVGVQVDSAVGIRGIEIHRSLTPTGTFTLIGYITAVNGVSSYSITDVNVETSGTEYYYKAIVIDSCGLQSITSNISKSVLLNVVSNTNRTNALSWTDYQSYLGNVSAWNVYRSVDDVFNPAPIATLAGGVFTFIDDIEEFVPNSGRFSYYVQAVEGPGNPYNLSELSNSNIVQTYHTDSIFIPNAFTPRGFNKVFLPLTQYVEKTEYKVSIYDRWGLKVWEAADDTEGWDGGKYEGGLYAYVVEYKNAFGEYKRINGTVLMIR